MPPPRLDPGVRDAILAWYDTTGRSLPFRGARDPYLILVSEVMAQQTQISRVADAWREFTSTFPTIRRLAAASPADVLRAWRGLGYNRRGLSLWRAARVIVEEHGGAVPQSVDSLERLPGIGPYTARAVAAIAFGAPVGAVDTNVRRVLSRVSTGLLDGIAAADLQRLADAAVPPDRPADWTHAVMDVGATFCRTTRPDCGPCPAREWCRYAAGIRDEELPPRPARTSAPRERFPATSRWLRGRILDRLRDAGHEAWHPVDATIGVHDEPAVRACLDRLARDGLVELHPDRDLTARLPIA
jgi:A/G-specific adenine glycosylase